MGTNTVEIRLGELADIDSWMELVETVRESFPGLETREDMEAHRNTVLEFLRRRSAVCALQDRKVVGALLFSREESALCFLAVDAAWRRQHIAEKMVGYALRLLPPERDISVTTYREGAPGGAAARAFYKQMGFQEGELTEEFGSPVQVFTRKR